MLGSSWHELVGKGFSESTLVTLQKGRTDLDAVANAMKHSRHVTGSAASFFAKGKDGEVFLEGLYGATTKGVDKQVWASTKGYIGRGRFFDVLVDAVAHESKVGFVKWSKSIENQIKKDAWLVQQGQIDSAHWHLIRELQLQHDRCGPEGALPPESVRDSIHGPCSVTVGSLGSSAMVEFVSMSKAEASAYLEQFLREMPSALERLRTHCSATGGPDLDGSVPSLDELWAWARPQFQWREGYVPPALGQPGAQISADELEPTDALPSWFHHPSAAGYARYSAETLWLVDGLARYLGEVVVADVPGAGWRVGNARRKGYLFQNQPVVGGLGGDEQSPLHTCGILVGRALRAESVPGVQSLGDVYLSWAGR